MNSKYVVSLALVSGIFTSCYKTIELEIPNQKPITVFDQPYTSSAAASISFRLTKTMSITDYYFRYKNPCTNGDCFDQPSFDSIPDATALIFEDGTLFETIRSNGSANYKGNKALKPGAIYSIELQSPREEKVNGTFRLPKTVLFTLQGSPVKNDNNQTVANLKVTDSEPGVKNYYRVQTRVVTTVNQKLPPISSASSEGGIGFSTTSKLLGDFNGDDPILSDSGEDGYQKYFSGYAFFTDELFDGGSAFFDVICNTQDDIGNIQMDMIFTYRVECESISEEQFKFEQSKQLQLKTNGDPFAQPTEIKGNLKGIIGVFSSATKKVIVID